MIYSQEDAGSLRAFATRLEKFDKAMRMLRGIEDPPIGPANRLTIYVVPSVASVQRVAGKGGANVAGFYIGRAGGSIAIVPRRAGGNGTFDMSAETVLLHEYAHHFMMSEAAGAAYPAWFVEGFAEFNSTTRFEKDGSLGFGLPASHRAYGVQLLSISAEKLFTSDTSSRDARLMEAFYGRAWLLTHYLTFEKARRGQLTSYLQAVNGGKDSLAAARETFGDLKTLDAELDRYRNRRRLPFLQFSPAEITIGAISIRDLSRAEDALMELRIRSDRGVNRDEARELVTKIRKAAAPFPNDAAAQAILAEAEYDAGDYDAAEAAADRALGADAHHVDALLYKGRALMAKAGQAKSKDAKPWRNARDWFVRANKRDPEHPEPLLLYYSSFREQGASPSANAVEGLLKAHDLSPQDRGLRMMVARELLVAGKGEEARVTLAPIAYDPHGGAIGKVAAALLVTLKDHGAKAALQAWDKAGPTANDTAD